MPPDALILAFDTSAAHCAAALLCGNKVIASAFEPMDKGQAERLMPLLSQVLAQGGVTLQDLTALAVGTGPGNFTGVRIAVSAARGLALSLGIPAIGVTRFEALSHGQPRPLLVVEDARRGDVYTQAFAKGAASDPQIIALSDLPAQNTPQTGSAAGTAAHLNGPVLLPLHPAAEAIARVAATRLSEPQPRPAPFYLRSADAAPPADPPPVILP